MRSAIPDSSRRDGPSVGRLGRAALVAALALGALAARAQGQESVPPPRGVTPGDTVVTRSVGVLRPGDVLEIVVYRDKELSNKYLIDSRGYVQIPGLGVILAAGLDPTQVKERLADSLRARGFERPELSVQPLVRVSVLGQVRTPGLYPVEPGTTLIQLITLAGGPIGEADLRKTRVVRDGRGYTVDLESALAGSAAGRIVLYSNDYVVVPKKTGFTRENLAFLFGLLGASVAVINLIVTIQRTK